ncbi:MAG: dihydroorotate dehydrogenase electron transfer subunit [Alphaproteobacteria bacterium]|nr:dihydroorotate dehydrogenase electron transfer subunit [Alphaproteobacteria bacterium]
MHFQKVIRDLTVLSNIRLNDRHFVLDLMAPDPLPTMLPGQFAQILVEHSPHTFLRRPFSIHNVDYHQNTIRFLIQIKGDGTRNLSAIKERETLNVIFPLGNSFSLPLTGKVLLVGGGCGVAPLLFLARFLNQNHIHPDILVGFRTKKEVSEIESYAKYGNVRVITDDGTEGEKGLVTDHPVFQKERLDYRKIYCCGPEAMMKAVAGLARFHGVDCEVSLENTMACGFGVCLCCITPTDKGNERVCVEGPVFNTNRLNWFGS